MFEDRQYQTRSVSFVVPRLRAFVVAPAGAGKTRIAALATKQKAQPFDCVHVLVNTREQCDQMRKAMAGVGLCPMIDLNINCVAAQPDVSGADLVIVDEAHHFPAVTWWTTIFNATCPVWGFSATPFSGDWERDDTLKAFFGKENFITIPREEVMAGGSITKGHVVLHDLDQEGEFDSTIDQQAEVETRIRSKRYPLIGRDEHLRRCRWQFTVEALQKNERRNEKIVSLATEETRSVLILVSSIEHGHVLESSIPGSKVVFSKIGKKKRGEIIEAFRSGELRVMIATSLADEGMDTPRATVLILAAGGKSSNKLEQRAGRVMRPFEGKESGIIHDFTDRGSKMAYNQGKARVRTYKRLGYSIQ